MKSLKLNKLQATQLSNREMKEIAGGAGCCCACAYAGNGGSSTMVNLAANQKGNLWSPSC